MRVEIVEGDITAQAVDAIVNAADDPARELAMCHTSSLAVVDEMGASSIAFPAISTGVYGYPIEEAARVALRAVREASTRVEHVRFVLFDREAHTVFLEAWNPGRS